jgi:L-arabinokinase
MTYQSLIDHDLGPFAPALAANAAFFETGAPLVVARAPGRLDLMGGIADYSGALVLELPLAVAAFAAAQASAAPEVAIRSMQAAAIDAHTDVVIPLDQLAPSGAPLPYAAARALLAADPRAHWAAYVAGALVVLGHERGVLIDRGVRLIVDSQVPPGKGVSSSAAIEVAAMQAICAIYGIDLPGRDLAMLCQKVENLVVGAPCGVMDQMTSACGEAGKLLALLCQPAELEAPVALPEGLEVWGVDSGIRHAVSGADYGSVRVGAFMGYRIIAELAGLRATGAPPSIADPQWRGYLANISPALWEQQFRDALPEAIGGAAFLARYGDTTDTVTSVDPQRTYAVRQPTAHPIYEHHRVRLFRALLLGGAASEEERALLGELMFQSHASYGACGLGSDGTDRLVDLARAAGPQAGIYGAKITGGGSGGTVAILTRAGAADAVRAIAAAYERESGRETTILSGSSPGAKAFGVRWVRQ